MENRVGFWPRLGAYLIDFVLLGLLAYLARDLVHQVVPGAVERIVADELSGPEVAEKMADSEMASAREWVVVITRFSIAMNLVGVMYALIEGLSGWTPGKLLLGIRVVTDDGHLAPVSRLMIRYAVKYSGPLLGLAGLVVGATLLHNAGEWVAVGISLGCLLALGKSRQALQDRIAGTAVLRKSDILSRAPVSTATA